MFRCVYEEACPYSAPDWHTVVDHLASEHGITGDAEERQYVQFMPGTVSPWVAQWHLMAGVQVHIDYRVPAWDPSWPCAHCQTVLTLRTCTYTPNRVGRARGSLTTPAISAARTAAAVPRAPTGASALRRAHPR